MGARGGMTWCNEAPWESVGVRECRPPREEGDDGAAAQRLYSCDFVDQGTLLGVENVHRKTPALGRAPRKLEDRT